MSEYLHVDVCCIGTGYPFWIKREGTILAHTQLCRSRQEVAEVLRNYLRGLWRKGHISGREKLIINDPVVAEAWDLNRFRDTYRGWVQQVEQGHISFREAQ
jgi:hypothetical protein